jgi:hypothetical protein
MKVVVTGMTRDGVLIEKGASPHRSEPALHQAVDA